MKAKRLEVLEKFKKGELTAEQADNELLVLYNVSSSTCYETTHTTKSDWDEPVIKHFSDESNNDDDWDSPVIRHFRD